MNQRVLITGASHGIGKAAAERFAKEGCTLILNCRQSVEELSALEFYLKKNYSVDCISLIGDMSNEEWHRVMGINLDSVFYCCREAIPYMLSKKSGSIVNISSVWGNIGASMEVAYSASKGAVNSFTKALAKELAPSNIRVNAAAFGTNSCFSAEERAALEEEIPIGRYGTPQEAAECIYRLATAPAYLTGQIITMDGGWC